MIRSDREAAAAAAETAELEPRVRSGLASGASKEYRSMGDRVRGYVLYAVVAVIVAGAIIGYGIRQTANSTEAALQLSCPAYRDIASLPLDVTTKQLGLGIVADFRRAYDASCVSKYGQLEPPDPRIAEYLRTHP